MRLAYLPATQFLAFTCFWNSLTVRENPSPRGEGMNGDSAWHPLLHKLLAFACRVTGLSLLYITRVMLNIQAFYKPASLLRILLCIRFL